jgi:hypothetical protein
MQVVPMQVSPVRQHCPQPQRVSPRAQSDTHEPETQICPQAHPPGHDAGAHWYCEGVAGLVERLQVLPEGQVPGQ